MQSFAAVASSGSLSAAARKLGCSQPTLSRHIAALEMQTETRLFERTPGGLDLTEDGAAGSSSANPRVRLRAFKAVREPRSPRSQNLGER